MNQADLTDRILMIIGDLTINGTTRLQKYGFLLHMKHGHDLKTISKTQKELEFYSDWKPYWYGSVQSRPCRKMHTRAPRTAWLFRLRWTPTSN